MTRDDRTIAQPFGAGGRHVRRPEIANHTGPQTTDEERRERERDRQRRQKEMPQMLKKGGPVPADGERVEPKPEEEDKKNIEEFSKIY